MVCARVILVVFDVLVSCCVCVSLLAVFSLLLIQTFAVLIARCLRTTVLYVAGVI